MFQHALSACKNLYQGQKLLINKVSASLENGQNVRCLQLWADWRMKKDVRRRQALEDNYELKVRLNTIKRNNILPPEIRDIAREDFNKMLPNDVKMMKIRPRCVITSRPRGNVLRWRLSRIMFRHLSDYNKIAGIQRAMW